MADTATTTAEPVELTIAGGIKVKITADEAKAYNDARAKEKAERDELARTAGAAKAERERAAEEAAKAKRDAELAAAEKAGEVAKVRDILTGEHARERAKLHSRIADREIRAAILSQPGVVASALDDIIRAASGAFTVTDAGSLDFLDEAGKPIRDAAGGSLSAEAWAKQFLEKRPYFRTTTVPAGGDRKAVTATGGKVMSADGLEALSPIDRAKFFAEGGRIG